MRSARRLIPIACFLALAVLPVLAADTSIAGAVILLTVGTEDGSTDTIRRVVVSSAELYMDQQGIIALESGARPGAGDLPESVFEEAEAMEADFVLHGIVRPQGDEVTVTLLLHFVETGEILARASATEQVGLTLDRAIAGLTGNVLEQARPYLVAAATEGRARADAETVPPGTMTGDDGDRPIGPRTVAATTSAPPNRLLALSAAFSPLVPVDAAASYFGLSYGASLSLFVLPFPRDVLGVGLVARGVRADVTGVVTTADLLLAPLGVAVRITAPTEPFAPYLRFAGGAAWLQATSAVGEEIESFVPYVGGELGVRIGIVRAIGVEASVGFEAFFEQSVLILGFAPSIGIAVEL